MVLLVCCNHEMHAGIVVIVEVENRSHGALCQFHASQPWVVVWNESIEGHRQLEQPTHLSLCFGDSLIPFPESDRDAILSHSVVDYFHC